MAARMAALRVGPSKRIQEIGGAVDARIPRILHLTRTGNGRAVS